MDQPSLPFDESIDTRFQRFHERHPEVYDGIVKLCRQWLVRGRDRWAVEAAFAVLRWQRRIAGLPDDAATYKLNDHYTSRYARLIMDREPDLDGIFELRRLRA